MQCRSLKQPRRTGDPNVAYGDKAQQGDGKLRKRGKSRWGGNFAMEKASVRIRFRSLGNSFLPVCSNPSDVILHRKMLIN